MSIDYIRHTGWPLARWLGVAAALLLGIAVVLLVPAAAPTAGADDCSDAEVIFARGTSEPAGLGRVGDALVDALRAQTPGMNIDTYGVNYAASRLQLHAGDGANDTINHVKEMADRCPDTQLVLGGYSQGASVMDIVAGVPVAGISWGSALPAEYADNIAAVAVFGNPAVRMGGSLTSQSALLGAKAIDLCNASDPICHEGAGNQWESHTDGYIPVMTDQAATFVAGKIQSGVPHMQEHIS